MEAPPRLPQAEPARPEPAPPARPAAEPAPPPARSDDGGSSAPADPPASSPGQQHSAGERFERDRAGTEAASAGVGNAGHHPRSSGDLPPIRRAQFRPSDIEADAALMQFKAGGDEHGVTDRLRGVSRWEPALDNPITVWEANDGRRLVADGHQRLGLAKRLESGGHPPITLDAKVLREAEGWTAPGARAVAAIKNMAEGSGTALDAAKVIRDLGEDEFASWNDRLPQRVAVVREGKELARLSPQAFSAVVNEVIPADQAAVVGRLLPDEPDAHMAMIELLHEEAPPNAREAETIVRQAIEDGFHRGVQTDMFGTHEAAKSLYGIKAKIIHEAQRHLGGRARLFGTAAKEGDTLASVGNRIEQEASAKESTANATAAQLVDRLATRRGNPISDALDVAARKVAEGGRRADAVREFIERVRSLDQEVLVRGGGHNNADRNSIDDGQGPGTAETGQFEAFGDLPRAGRPGPEGGGGSAENASEGVTPGTPDRDALLDALLRVHEGRDIEPPIYAHLKAKGFLVEDGKTGRARLTPKGRAELIRAGRLDGDGESGFISADMLMAPFRAIAKMADFADWEAIRGDIDRFRQVFGEPRAAARRALEPMQRIVSAGVFTNDARLRGLAARFNSSAIRELADHFYAEAGRGSGTARTYHEAVQRASVTRTQQAFEALEPHLAKLAAIGRIRDLLATPGKPVRATAAEREAAAKLRDLLKGRPAAAPAAR